MEHEGKFINIKIPDNVLSTIKNSEQPDAVLPPVKRKRLKQQYRKRLAIRLACFILIPIMVICLTVWLFTYKNAIEVYAADELIGVVKMDKQLSIESLIRDVKDRLEEGNQAQIIVNPVISLKPVHAAKSAISSKDELLNGLCESLPFQVQASAFILEGKPIAILRDRAEALTVRDNIFAKYVTNGSESENVSFVENVSIEDIFVEKPAIITMGKAFDTLTSETAHSSVYTVKPNDVLGLIAEKNKMTLSALISANPGITAKSTLKVGQELNVETYSPLLSVKTVETITIEELAPAPIQQQINPRAKTTRVLQAGQDGRQRVTKSVTKVNGIIQDEIILNTVILEEPAPQIVEMPPQ